MDATQTRPTAAEIINRRNEAGLTQQQAADLVGVGIKGWQHYEYGKARMLEPCRRLFWILTDPRPAQAARRLIKKHT